MAGYVEDTFLCIKKMKDAPGDYFERWLSIREIWAKRINSGPTRQEEDYTPHNHTNHNVGIYKILSAILIPASAYESEINTENLFVLNLAVLFHDIMMAYDPSLRSEHGVAARDFILAEFPSEDFNIKPFEYEAIAEVIVGHTDIKDSSGKVVAETIDLLPSNVDDFPNGQCGKINVPLLSSLLRLADELDIHTDRIHLFSPHKRRITDSSKPHWRKCEILMYPQKTPQDVTVIQLVPAERTILADGNIDNDVQLIVDVRNKIFKELRQLNDKVFKKGYLSNWQFTNIEIKANGEILETVKKIDSLGVNPFSAESESIVGIIDEPTEIAGPVGELPVVSSSKVVLASDEAQKKIKDWVFDKELLLTGHFKVDNDFRVRDWIDSQTLLEDGKCLDYICDLFVDRLKNLDDKVFIVGIDHYGLLIASLMGMKTNNPFSYVVSKRLSEVHIEKEKEIAIPNGYQIILVTDVIITLKTVESSIEFLKQHCELADGQIAGIFSIFIRDSLNHATGKTETIDSHVLSDKIFALERSLVVELCNKNECIFLKQGIDMYSNLPQII